MTNARGLLLALLLLVALPCLVAAQSGNDDARAKGIEVRAGPAAVFLVLYLVSTLIMWFLWFRNGRQGYMLNLLVGMLCMTIGLLLRVKDNYAWQFLFTFLSPCAFLANDYVVLKRLSRALGTDISSSCLFISPRGIVWIFILSDVITFCAQTVGTVFVIVGGKWSSLGQNIAIAGLALQLVSFALFTRLLSTLAKRLRSRFPHVYYHNSGRRLRPWSKGPVTDVRTLLLVLGLTCIGILIRSVFRLIEQADGFFGYIATHEAFLYAFDTAPLWLSLSFFCLVWPPRYIGGCAGAQESVLLRERGTAFKRSKQTAFKRYKARQAALT
ncbi:RTA1 like protein-domain-containing protein [Rhodotorula diobovata]|uniref:RTA1 like protein-domain-containing protein n=1 Tax=Rhodotorula diobovata TaxID=5288 RepID=A0A5C5FPJ0_9BASI|nr:RTA1 like protein-domain-containing protein [Rhodotorula diobovata]